MYLVGRATLIWGLIGSMLGFARDTYHTRPFFYDNSPDRKNWNTSASYLVHRPDLTLDVTVATEAVNLFMPPRSLFLGFEDTANFQTTTTRMFEHIYQVRAADANTLGMFYPTFLSMVDCLMQTPPQLLSSTQSAHP